MVTKRAALLAVPAVAHRSPTLAEAAAYLRLDPGDLDSEFTPTLIDPKAELYCVRAFVGEDEGFADVQIAPFTERQKE